MKHSSRDFDRALTAAIGDEPALALDLAAAFRDGATAHRARLARAGDAAEWRDAAARLQGLAASFGAIALMRAAAGAQIAADRREALAAIDEALTPIL